MDKGRCHLLLEGGIYYNFLNLSESSATKKCMSNLYFNELKLYLDELKLFLGDCDLYRLKTQKVCRGIHYKRRSEMFGFHSNGECCTHVFFSNFSLESQSKPFNVCLRRNSYRISPFKPLPKMDPLAKLFSNWLKKPPNQR